MRVRKAVIPAAGLGVRFLPATKAQPKEMIPLIDKPTIQYIIEEAVASGITDILIITGRGKRAIEDHFDHAPELEHFLEIRGKMDALETIRAIGSLANIYYVRQKEPRGLGHAVACAEAFVGNEPFAVLLGDDVVVNDVPCLRQMLDVYEDVQASVIAVEEVPEEDVSKYGVIKGMEVGSNLFAIEDLVEKPAVHEAPSRMAVMGRYVLPPHIFDLLAETQPGAGGEIQLTDALRKLVQEDVLYGYAFTGRRYDVGSNLGYLKATVELALSRSDTRESFLQYLRGVVGEDTR